MTSVPKPLKFMRPHYDTMKAVYDKLKDKKCRELCSDVISVLAMTMGEGRECLKYRILGKFNFRHYINNCLNIKKSTS
jgi:26S proteasome regulatory subunit N1